ncbi:MAG: DUF2341 domain-containing protein, partial [Thermoplasmatota archaeon]
MEKTNKIGKKNIFKTSKAIVLMSSIVFLLLITPSFSSISQNDEIMQSFSISTPVVSTVGQSDSSFIWEDSFEHSQYIDDTYSNHYLIKNGTAQMMGTMSSWTDASWTQMKKITLESEESLENAIIQLSIEYDSDMQNDYQDIRFTYNNDSYFLPYWIEEKNSDPNNPSAKVWVKLSLLEAGTSQLLLFYGNEQASDESNYWAVFDENSWNKGYVHDQQITYHMAKEGAWAPSVSFGEDRYLVSWVEGVPQYLLYGMIYRMQIRGCFYDENGQLIQGRFDITPWNADPLQSFRCEDPAIAYGQSGGDTHFLVAYEYFENPTDKSTTAIHGAIVPRSTTQGSDVTRFTICDAAGVQADPRVAFDTQNDQFFVVWEDGREGTSNYNIYGQLFDIYGNPVGNEKIISNRPHSQCQPWITFDTINNHFLVVWEEGINAAYGPFEIWGQLFDVNGNELGSAQRLSEPGSTNTDYNYPSAAFSAATQRFLVVWQKDDISAGSTRGPIWATVLDQDGIVLSEPHEIAAGTFQRPKAIPYLSSSFFVSYDGSGEIWGKLVSSTGSVYSDDLQLSDTESSAADWVAIGSNGDRIFVSWEDLRILYVEPYESMNLPDIFGNIWSFNMPTGSAISYTVGDEISIILDATVTSVKIAPENLENWYQFSAVKTGDISFDILDGETLTTLKSDVSAGVSLADLSTSSIRLQAHFQRENPATSPLLDSWNVSYMGIDEMPPETSILDIEGTKGLHEWYTSESVILWLHAEDLPTDTGSGIKTIYYTLNDGSIKEYNQQTGLILSTSQASDWMGVWDIVFWAEDNAGNQENRYDSENSITISIDADKPYVEITSPADEEQVEVPFWVKANPSDNVGVDRVEFDIEPFGEREGLPYVDTEPPYEWYCDVKQGESLGLLHPSIGVLGTNKMVRARVFDEAGQSWTHEVWVYITNWDSGTDFQNHLCLLYATGQGSVNTDGLNLDGITLGQVSWDFTEGSTVFSAGLNGIRLKTGSQHGSAILFLGYTSNNVVAGIAGSV